MADHDSTRHITERAKAFRNRVIRYYAKTKSVKKPQELWLSKRGRIAFIKATFAFVLLFGFTTLLSPSALANQACKEIAQVKTSLGLVRELQQQHHKRGIDLTIEKLERSLTTLSISAITPKSNTSRYQSDLESIQVFREQVYQALKHQRQGDRETHQSYIDNALGNGIGKSLLKLHTVWNCSAYNLTAPIEHEQQARARLRNFTPDASINTRIKDNLSSQAPTQIPDRRRPAADQYSQSAHQDKNVSRDWLLPALITFIVLALIFALLVRVKARSQNERRAPRHNIVLPIRIKQKNRVHTAKVVEVSQTGCKVQHSIENLEKNLSIRLVEKHRKGRVIWSNSHYAGIKFTKSLSLERLNRVIRAYRNHIKQQRFANKK
jgi:hypothetical protein